MGGNYFADYLPASKFFICWDKRYGGLVRSFADCELAWGSENLGVARLFRFVWDGFLQGNMKNKADRFHPTQKPVELYTWCLSNFAEKGDLILDTHVGSASSLVACERLGFEYIGFEIDKQYYKLAKARLEEEKRQIKFCL